MFIKKNIKGVTLIELMVSLAITSIVMAAVTVMYQNQVRDSNVQQSLVNMQQNARMGMFLLERELRTLAYDPTGMAAARLVAGTSASIRFQVDANANGIIEAAPTPNMGDEIIDYALTNDVDSNGIADGMPCSLGRQRGGGGGFQPVADIVEALNFVYLDATGTRVATPLTALTIPTVQSIRITIVARSTQQMPGLFGTAIDTTVYRNRSFDLDVAGDIVLPQQNDRFKRFLVTTEIKCRNLALTL